MASEMESLTACNVRYLTDLPQEGKPIKRKWVFKIKFNANGEKIYYKAGLVAKRCSQQKGVDYEETFASFHYVFICIGSET